MTRSAIPPRASRPSQAPEPRPSQLPQARPSQVPQARPSQVPQARPSQVPQARPSQVPQARPSQGPQAQAQPTTVPRHLRTTGGPRGRPKGAFSQHRRLDALRALLQRHPKGLTIYELASELSVTPRSLRRYLGEVRRELDLVAGVEHPGGARLWRLAANEIPRKVEVRRTQAYALLAARRLFEPMRGSTLFEEIDLATQKLAAVARRPGRGPNAGVADAGLEDRFLYIPFAPKNYEGHAAELDDLFQAVADLRPLRCRYRRSDGSEEAMTVHPYAMVLYKDAIYCVGLHLERNQVETFLLDCMRDTECLVRGHFEVPAGFRVDDYVQGQFGFTHGGEAKRVVIDFDPRVAEFVRTRRVHPSQAIEPQPDGGVRLTLELADLTELGTWVLGFGALAKVVEPAELVERVKGQLAAALARYDETHDAAEASPAEIEPLPPPAATKPRRARATSKPRA